MRQRIALFRMALLVAVWFAASANGAPVLAQPGGTGGTVGKTKIFVWRRGRGFTGSKLDRKVSRQWARDEKQVGAETRH
jgi:hypothetical protein